MPVIKVSAAAEEDLKGIWAYVAEINPEAAGRLVKDITRRFSLLRDNPHMGREQDKLLVNLRSFVVKNYFIFYLPFEGGIEVLRVLHGSRDIGSIFEGFFDSL
ncbi:MAG TPA: type II toxin-antitoxin system RelE/ParE family toxin [Pyrinomonadaceae bacterium]|jgi:toxin ParE1/3/4|nr:type II toxin-antitoxin system RelE/ParE family toxin [Pyrinomonadaceae bacterium]